jgi:cell division control protein 6
MMVSGTSAEYQVSALSSATVTSLGATSTVTETVEHYYSQIFLDKDLFEVDHVPDCILHRETQITEIKAILADTIRPKNIVIIGGFGSGKTATIRHIGQDLPLGYRLVYLSCSTANTQARVYSGILTDLATSRSWLPLDEYRKLVEAELKKHRYIILILDEADKFLRHRDSGADDFFYILSRHDEWRNVVAILVSNRIDIEPLLRKHLDPRTLDTFRWKRVEFTEYNAPELSDIGEDRMKKGLRDNAWDKDIIAKIALASYNQGLGARGVIDITREAGLRAEREERDKITPEDVREASNVDPYMRFIQSLTPIDKTLVRIIFQQGPIQMQRLHGEYYPRIAETYGGGESLDVCERHVQKLATFGIVIRRQSGRGRGKGTETWVSIAPEMLSAVKKSLSGDTDPTAAPVNSWGTIQ